tara:strand:- start:130 stop:315 length:186 start_codon:yes stop_codon:yes gene_type:complete
MNVVLKFVGIVLLIFFIVVILGYFLTKNIKYLYLAKAVFNYAIYSAFIIVPVGMALKYLHL